ncbi:MAG: N-6 DNA methylase [Candidatus Aenigmatarchaeota archaeon]
MINVYSDEIENYYSQESDLHYRRSLGQFFTPFRIACFMADWILSNPKNKLYILDPATGFGIFERALKLQSIAYNKTLFFELWEIDKNISNSLKGIISYINISAEIINNDFLESPWDRIYDGIIANPPYIKHHYIENKKKIYQNICKKTHFKFSIQTNIYCWFLVKCINLLNDGGKLAFIVPSEFLNANYGEKIKEYLLQTGYIRHLINIHFKENVFDNAITTSVIILAEKMAKRSDFINFYNVDNINSLSNLNDFLNNHHKTIRNVINLNPKIKWRNYFNGYKDSIINNKLIPLKNIGRFSRGIATGCNKFFTLTEKEAKEYKIPKKCLLPCVTKANHVKDIYFSQKDFEFLKISGKKVYLFDGERSHDKNVLNYISKGEAEGINNRFLTKHRRPWFALEKRVVSKIWVGVFGRNGIKFIWNDSNCITLTCFHVFYPTSLGEKYLDIFFLYLNTDFSRELIDREKREYGDGLEKFEPNDINKSYVFNFAILSNETLDKLRGMQKEFIIGDISKKNEILVSANKIFKQVFESNSLNTLCQD